MLLCFCSTYFNPPSPCGEGLEFGQGHHLMHLPFQSTLPVWGGTATVRLPRCVARNFNPPSPCGEGRNFPAQQPLHWDNFNPPSPCGEGRIPQTWPLLRAKYFNPPSPCGEGLLVCFQVSSHNGISIHPPRVGRDRRIKQVNPVLRLFQSTLPVWGGTPLR